MCFHRVYYVSVISLDESVHTFQLLTLLASVRFSVDEIDFTISVSSNQETSMSYFVQILPNYFMELIVGILCSIWDHLALRKIIRRNGLQLFFFFFLRKIWKFWIRSECQIDL